MPALTGNPVSSFPNGFTSGVTIRGLPVGNAQPGQIFWVNNSSILSPGGIPGSDFGPGSYQRPFQTVEGALANGKLTNYAGRGDILMVMPNHAETITNNTLFNLSCAGVAIIGCGSGDTRPTFTLSTATSATITISANSMAFVNCKFVANFANIAALFTVNAKDFYVGGCDFIDTSSILNFVNIFQSSSTTNAANGIWSDSCNFYGLGAASNTTMFNMLGTQNRLTIKNIYIAHAATTGGGMMQIASGKSVTNLICSYNTGNFVGAATASLVTFIIAPTSSNSGVINNNYVKSLCDTTPLLVTASSGFRFFNNYYQANADKSGFLLPAVDS